MAEGDELELLVTLDGASFEAADGYVVEFKATRVSPSKARPHEIDYSLVFRSAAGGAPLVRFDNAHAAPKRGGRHVAQRAAYDHWHRTADDPGRPYAFATAAQLLEDFWREVKRALDEKGIRNDL